MRAVYDTRHTTSLLHHDNDMFPIAELREIIHTVEIK